MKVRIQAPDQYFFGQDIFDYFVAEYQWRTNYNATPNIVYGEPEKDAVNIAFVSMPNHISSDLDQADIIILDNIDEAFGRGTQALYDIFDAYPNSYLSCNSYLHPDHVYFDKLKGRIINTMIAWTYHRRYYTEPVFASALEFRSRPQDPASMVWINGKNRSWREYLSQLLATRVPELEQHNIIHNQTVTPTAYCWYEDLHDTKFRQWCNQEYANDLINPVPPDTRWPALPSGVNGRHGQLEWQDWFVDAIRKNSVIVFPETTWQNNILAMNEKCLKCFIHLRWAFPFGGARMHQMLEDLGFHTARSLLPRELQAFDQDPDHQRRWQSQCDAVVWLQQNSQVFHTTMAKQMLQQNLVRCIMLSSSAGAQLYSIIEKCHNEKTRYRH